MKNLLLLLRETKAEHPELLWIGLIAYIGSSFAIWIQQDISDLNSFIMALIAQLMAATVWILACYKLKLVDYEDRVNYLRDRIRRDEATVSEIEEWRTERQKYVSEVRILKDQIIELKNRKEGLVRELAEKTYELGQLIRELKNSKTAMWHLEELERKHQSQISRKAEERKITEQNALVARLTKAFPHKKDIF